MQSQVPNSESPATIFPDPTHPDELPFTHMNAPPHISSQIWQDSFYDASSSAPMGAFVQLPDGPCHLETGRLVDGEFPGGKGTLWKQV